MGREGVLMGAFGGMVLAVTALALTASYEATAAPQDEGWVVRQHVDPMSDAKTDAAMLADTEGRAALAIVCAGSPARNLSVRIVLDRAPQSKFHEAVLQLRYDDALADKDVWETDSENILFVQHGPHREKVASALIASRRLRIRVGLRSGDVADYEFQLGDARGALTRISAICGLPAATAPAPK
jgi:hypothetical protein